MASFGFNSYGTYISQSPNVDDERCLNLYPEYVEGQGKSQFALYPTPGLQLALTLPTNLPVVAMIQVPGSFGQYRTFAVSNRGFYEIIGSHVAFGFLLRGTMSNGDPALLPGDCSMAYGAAAGGVGILIASGFATYSFLLATNTFAPVVTGLTSVAKVGYCDGFYLATQYNGNQVYASAPADPTTWPSTSFTAISVFNDSIADMVVNQRQVWFFGQTASVVYYDSGNSPFPFDVIQGSYIEQGAVQGANGSIAGTTVQKLDNSVFWLGVSRLGQAIIWRANGYTPQRVSTFAVETAMQRYAAEDTIQDAVAYTYQDQGHGFYVIYFPQANSGRGATWVYDVAIQMWHERSFLNPSDGKMYAHRTQCHAVLTGNDNAAVHLVGDWENTGNIYWMQIPTYNGDSGQWDFASDFGNPIQRTRRAPYISTEKEWIVHRQFELDMETGLGPIPGLPGVSPSPNSIILQDSVTPTTLWKVTVQDDGVFSFTSVASGTPQTLILNFNGNSYQVFVQGGSAMTLVQVPFIASYPLTYPMATMPSYLQTAIIIKQGFVPLPNVTTNTPQPYYRGPEVILRWSDDSGHTWKYNVYQDTGAAGAYKQRVRFSRLGRSRQRIYEVKWTDPVPFRIVDVYVKADQDYTPQKRLVKKLAETA